MYIDLGQEQAPPTSLVENCKFTVIHMLQMISRFAYFEIDRHRDTDNVLYHGDLIIVIST